MFGERRLLRRMVLRWSSLLIIAKNFARRTRGFVLKYIITLAKRVRGEAGPEILIDCENENYLVRFNIIAFLQTFRGFCRFFSR